jgi:hypothetical protein
MTDNIVYGIDFGKRREQESRDLIAEAKTGQPIAEPIQGHPVIILHDDQFIDPPSDCAS